MATTHTPIQTAHAAGAQAARDWFANPVKSLGLVRDLELARFIAEIDFSIEKLDEVSAFEEGFADGLAQVVSGGAK